jgi:Protein of unknown function (DUF1553)/Protein of unknown function (DUF1549)/Planctomycete cytochrome C
LLPVLLLLAPNRGSAAPAEPDRKGLVFFENKIRPILVQHCYKCHSTEGGKPKGGLRLDNRPAVLKGGDSGPTLVPGQPDQSLLLKALRHEAELKMPPKARLSDQVIADFRQWVQMGAPDPREAEAATAAKSIDLEAGRKFWAFQPLGQHTPPSVKNAGWVRGPVDRFILARLEDRKLTPNPLAAREKLIRRASFDLWGLPPSPEEIDSFMKDASPDAYEKVIDRLLAGDAYGERWARHWLDVTRYAESGGYEFDGDRPGAYHYRDFVIRAMNGDMPYDQFVRLQLAGDRLQPTDYQAVSATGFLVAGPYPGQITAKTRELIRYDHLDDMLATTGSSLLGLTLGCARCHDHKYDPIPQKDYYRFLANMAGTDSTTVKSDPKPEVYRKAKEVFDQAHAPLLAVRNRLEGEMAVRLEKWLPAAQGQAKPTWLLLDSVTATAVSKANLTRLPDGSLLASGPAPKADVYTLVFHTYQKGVTAIRLEALPDPSLPKTGPGRGPDGTFLLTEASITASPLNDPKAKPTAVKLRAGKASFEAPGQALAGVLDADKGTGWGIAGQPGKSHSAFLEIDGALGFAEGTVLTVVLKFEGTGAALGRLRLGLSTQAQPLLTGTEAPQAGAELVALLTAQGGKVTDKNRAALTPWFRQVDPETRQAHEAVLEHAKKEPQPDLATVFAATDGKGGDVHFLVRGEVERKNGVAAPGFLQVLTTAGDGEQHWLKPASGQAKADPRSALANWITDADKGAGRLLARVIVNRLWQHHFGRGIVATPSDFGEQGEPPSHSELLDWLAVDLIHNGWTLKRLHKMMVMSAVYMQASRFDVEALKVDPQNRLWGRMSVRRLEAESIRDALLEVSGSLTRTLYGPGTLDANSTRRSIYLTVKRSQPILMMQMFDAPETIQSVGERSQTTLPTQALALMNSPFVRQRAEKLAQRIRPKAGALSTAVEEAYRITLARPPNETERQRMLAFIERQTDSRGKTPAARDQAFTDFCQALLCLNEFVYVD